MNKVPGKNFEGNEMCTLEQRTQAYWTVSKCFNGKLDRTITTSRAIKVLNQTLMILGPDKRLRRSVNNLLSEIITQDTPRIEATIK